MGRLVTDERFRRLFGRDAAAALRELAEEGLELTLHEESALVATDPRLWDQIADGMRTHHDFQDRITAALVSGTHQLLRHDGEVFVSIDREKARS